MSGQSVQLDGKNIPLIYTFIGAIKMIIRRCCAKRTFIYAGQRVWTQFASELSL